jgi:hypothetical protein
MRGSRVAGALAPLTFVAVVAVGGCSPDEDEGAGETAEGYECPESMAEVDVLAFVRPETDSESIDADALAIDGVATASFAGPDESWSELGLAAGGEPVPPGFPATVAIALDEEGRGLAIQEVQRFEWYGGGLVRPEAEEGFVPRSGRWSDADFVVFFEPDAIQSDIDAVVGDVEADPQVDTTRFLDQEAAYEEFQQLFSDSPELVATVSPAILPSSLRVLGADLSSTEIQDLAESYEGGAGVREVVVGPMTTAFAVPDVINGLTSC